MIVHGGMIASLADSAMFVGAGDSIGHGVTAQLNVSFISAAMPGEWVEGESEIVKNTKHLAFAQGRIYVGDRTIAIFTGIIKKKGASL